MLAEMRDALRQLRKAPGYGYGLSSICMAQMKGIYDQRAPGSTGTL